MSWLSRVSSFFTGEENSPLPSSTNPAVVSPGGDRFYNNKLTSSNLANGENNNQNNSFSFQFLEPGALAYLRIRSVKGRQPAISTAQLNDGMSEFIAMLRHLSPSDPQLACMVANFTPFDPCMFSALGTVLPPFVEVTNTTSTKTTSTTGSPGEDEHITAFDRLDKLVQFCATITLTQQQQSVFLSKEAQQNHNHHHVNRLVLLVFCEENPYDHDLVDYSLFTVTALNMFQGKLQFLDAPDAIDTVKEQFNIAPSIRHAATHKSVLKKFRTLFQIPSFAGARSSLKLTKIVLHMPHPVSSGGIVRGLRLAVECQGHVLFQSDESWTQGASPRELVLDVAKILASAAPATSAIEKVVTLYGDCTLTLLRTDQQNPELLLRAAFSTLFVPSNAAFVKISSVDMDFQPLWKGMPMPTSMFSPDSLQLHIGRLDASKTQLSHSQDVLRDVEFSELKKMYDEVADMAPEKAKEVIQESIALAQSPHRNRSFVSAGTHNNNNQNNHAENKTNVLNMQQTSKNKLQDIAAAAVADAEKKGGGGVFVSSPVSAKNSSAPSSSTIMNTNNNIPVALQQRNTNINQDFSSSTSQQPAQLLYVSSRRSEHSGALFDVFAEFAASRPNIKIRIFTDSISSSRQQQQQQQGGNENYSRPPNGFPASANFQYIQAQREVQNQNQQQQQQQVGIKVVPKNQWKQSTGKCQYQDCGVTYGLFSSYGNCHHCGLHCCSSCLSEKVSLPPEYPDPVAVCPRCHVRLSAIAANAVVSSSSSSSNTFENNNNNNTNSYGSNIQFIQVSAPSSTTTTNQKTATNINNSSAAPTTVSSTNVVQNSTSNNNYGSNIQFLSASANSAGAAKTSSNFNSNNNINNGNNEIMTANIKVCRREKWQDPSKLSHCQFQDCRTTFGFFSRGSNCYCCGLVCCSSCITGKTTLPPTYPNDQVPVCSRCYATSEIIKKDAIKNFEKRQQQQQQQLLEKQQQLQQQQQQFDKNNNISTENINANRGTATSEALQNLNYRDTSNSRSPPRNKDLEKIQTLGGGLVVVNSPNSKVSTATEENNNNNNNNTNQINRGASFTSPTNQNQNNNNNSNLLSAERNNNTTNLQRQPSGTNWLLFNKKTQQNQLQQQQNSSSNETTGTLGNRTTSSLSTNSRMIAALGGHTAASSSSQNKTNVLNANTNVNNNVNNNSPSKATEENSSIGNSSSTTPRVMMTESPAGAADLNNNNNRFGNIEGIPNVQSPPSKDIAIIINNDQHIDNNSNNVASPLILGGTARPAVIHVDPVVANEKNIASPLEQPQQPQQQNQEAKIVATVTPLLVIQPEPISSNPIFAELQRKAAAKAAAAAAAAGQNQNNNIVSSPPTIQPIPQQLGKEVEPPKQIQQALPPVITITEKIEPNITASTTSSSSSEIDYKAGSKIVNPSDGTPASTLKPPPIIFKPTHLNSKKAIKGKMPRIPGPPKAEIAAPVEVETNNNPEDEKFRTPQPNPDYVDDGVKSTLKAPPIRFRPLRNSKTAIKGKMPPIPGPPKQNNNNNNGAPALDDDGNNNPEDEKYRTPQPNPDFVDNGEKSTRKAPPIRYRPLRNSKTAIKGKMPPIPGKPKGSENNQNSAAVPAPSAGGKLDMGGLAALLQAKLKMPPGSSAAAGKKAPAPAAKPSGPKIKTIFWKKLAGDRLRKSVLWNLDADKLSSPYNPETPLVPKANEPRLLTLFEIKKKDENGADGKNGGDITKDGKKKSAAVTMQRQQNVGIALKKMKKTPDQLKDAILSCDSNVFSSEMLDAVLKIMPQDDEIRNLKAEKSAPTPYSWGEVEDFLYTIAISVPDAKERLGLWRTAMEIPRQIELAETQLGFLNEAAGVISQENSDLVRVLRCILNIGNCVNKGTPQGNAGGFTLESLVNTLMGTKATDNKTTLLDLVFEHFGENETEKMDFGDELANKVQPALGCPVAGVSTLISSIANSVQRLKKIAGAKKGNNNNNNNQITTETEEDKKEQQGEDEDKLVTLMTDCHQKFSGAASDLLLRLQEMKDAVAAALEFLGEDKTADDTIIFNQIITFCKEFNKHRGAWLRKHQAIAKKKQQEFDEEQKLLKKKTAVNNNNSQEQQNAAPSSDFAPQVSSPSASSSVSSPTISSPNGKNNNTNNNDSNVFGLRPTMTKVWENPNHANVEARKDEEGWETNNNKNNNSNNVTSQTPASLFSRIPPPRRVAFDDDE